MTGPLAPLFAQVREGMIYRRGGESTCLPVYPNCTCPDCLALRALSAIERHVQDMERALEQIENRLPVDDDPYDGTANGVIRRMARAALPAREKEEE